MLSEKSNDLLNSKISWNVIRIIMKRDQIFLITCFFLKILFHPVDYDAPPDLIRNDLITPPCPQGSPITNYSGSNFSLDNSNNNNNRRRINSFVSNMMCSTDYQNVPLMSLPNFNNQDLFADCCYYCQKKKILSLASETCGGRPARKKCQKCDASYQEISPTISFRSSTSPNNKCVCKHPISLANGTEYKLNVIGLNVVNSNNRSPRSAPHITFMQ